ncbi:hypothetical protein [Acinetobacter phage HFM1]|nr:hypothetical protein [Acinetobacter phage HFM1]
MSKYHFDTFSVGETKIFKDTNRRAVTVSAIQNEKRNNLGFKFSCVQVDKDVFVTRVK